MAVEIEGAVGGETITVVSVGEINDVVVLAVVLVVVDVDGTVEVVVDDRGGGGVVVVEPSGFVVDVDGTVVDVVDVLVVDVVDVLVVDDGTVVDVVDVLVVVVDGTVVVVLHVVVVVVLHVVVVWQCAETELLPSWFVEALDVNAGSATRLSVTTATTATADRNPLNSGVILVRHVPTNSRKVTA